MTETHAPHPPRSKTLRLWLIIGSVAAVLGIVPIAIMGMMSVMASDAGTNAWINAFMFMSLTFPVAVIVGPVLAWIAYALRRERLSWILLFAPLAWPVLIVAIMIVGPNA
ncbi:hypothetical protein ACETK8_11380 [Brevundimonas staleyi]|uniref:DUF805 domain-containing protein n=1 Tax=Brevundimonas staleyi TaxID=74326 RepID=A0ABW0FQZ1_9CAUL